MIPWTALIHQGNIVARITQFPFRFFVPATILFIVSFGFSLQKRARPKVLFIITIASVIQVLFFSSLSVYRWHNGEDYLLAGAHIVERHNDEEVIKASFFTGNHFESLALIEKATPDYVPIYYVKDKNKYEVYKEEIIKRNPFFTKELKNGSLEVSWKGNGEAEVAVPILVYDRTTLELNGEPLRKEDIRLSSIGSVRLMQVEGENVLRVAYEPHGVFPFVLLFTGCSWLGCLFFLRRREFHL